MNEIQNSDLTEFLRINDLVQQAEEKGLHLSCVHTFSDEAVEGRNAFLEKREPNFEKKWIP